MHDIHSFLIGAVAAAAGFALPIAVQAGSADIDLDPHVTGSLLSAAIGAMIADHCDAISPRKLFALVKAWELKNYALKQGYTDEEIDKFLKSRSAQDQIRAAAEAYLAKQGVSKDDAASYCAAGAAEIAKGTLAGKLIRQH